MIRRFSSAIFKRKARMFSTSQDLIIKWIIVDEQGKKYPCEGTLGSSVLQSSINSGFQFEKACGGNAQCMTCHVHIPPEMESHPAYEEAQEKETDGLLFVVERSEFSRLACQMVVTQALHNRELIFKGQ